ncbi:MAG TPA: hypothetical protein VHY77_03940, partial [Acidimicrobiales bacterium]|nr:hypothetical protein [Acidimicrobiales bacterium]
MATTDQRSRRKGSRAPSARTRTQSGRGTPGTSEADVSAHSLTEAISVIESFVSAFEPGRYCGDDAALLVEQFTRGEHLCATGKALSAKRATQTEQHKRDGSRSAAQWLSRQTGESQGSAADSLRLAERMEDHPGLGEALRSGELSLTRARQVADVLAVDPESESELVEAARDRNETNRQLADRCLRAKARARS